MKKQALGFKSLPRAVRVGLRRAVMDEKPFALAPLNWLAAKAFGQKKVDRAYWKVLGPLVKADTFLGSAAQKITPKKLKKVLWENKIVFPTGKNFKPSMKSATGVEYSVPALSAPLKKAGPVGLAFLGTMKAEELLKGNKGNNNMNSAPIVKQADLQKAAEMLSHLKEQNDGLEKKARATELLYKQAELGQVKFPKSYAEYQEKVAELVGKDLNVVEEAIKMASSSEADTLGGLDNETSVKADPRSMFARSVIEN